MASHKNDHGDHDKRKQRHILKSLIKNSYKHMKFLADEMKNDTSKIDIIHNPKSNYDNLINDIIG